MYKKAIKLININILIYFLIICWPGSSVKKRSIIWQALDDSQGSSSIRRTQRIELHNLISHRSVESLSRSYM